MSRATVVTVDLVRTTSVIRRCTPDDLVRRIQELWTTDGKLVASRDEYTNEVSLGSGFDSLFKHHAL